MICKHILQITFLDKPELSFSHTVKWFQAFLFNTNYSTYYFSQLNGYTYMICK